MSGIIDLESIKGQGSSPSFPVKCTIHRCCVCFVEGGGGWDICPHVPHASLSLVVASNHLRGSGLFQTAECIHLHDDPSPQHTQHVEHACSPRRSGRACEHPCISAKKEMRMHYVMSESRMLGVDVLLIFQYTALCVCPGSKSTSKWNETKVSHVPPWLLRLHVNNACFLDRFPFSTLFLYSSSSEPGCLGIQRDFNISTSQFSLL